MDEIKTAVSKIDWDWLQNFGKEILAAIVVMMIGLWVAKWVDKFIRTKLPTIKGDSNDATVRPLLASVARYIIIFITIYMVLTILHIPTGSYLAAFGGAGVAIGLALQGTLSNVAAGVMMLSLRTMNVGDYIQARTVEGTVLEIGFFASKIKSPDGIYVVVPNAEIWKAEVRNYSKFKSRRININVDLDIDNDLEKIVSDIKDVIASAKEVINASTSNVVILSIIGRVVTIQAQCWVRADSTRQDTSNLYAAVHDKLYSEQVIWAKPVVAPKVNA